MSRLQDQHDKLWFEGAFPMGKDIKTTAMLVHKISDNVAGGKRCFKDLTREEPPVTRQRELCIFEGAKIGWDFGEREPAIQGRKMLRRTGPAFGLKMERVQRLQIRL